MRNDFVLVKLLVLLLVLTLSGCGGGSNTYWPVAATPPATPPPATPNPEFTADANTIILWHFDESSGTTAADSSTGGSYPATLQSSLGTPVPPVFASSGHSGFNNCLVLDGSKQQYASHAPPAGPWITGFSDQITIEFWCKFSSVSAPSILLCDNDVYYQIYLNTNRTLEIELGDGSNWQMDMLSNAQLSTDAWHYIAFTYDKNSNVAILYIDGAPDNTQHPTAPCNIFGATGSRGVYVGSFPFGSGNFFTGSLDEIRFSNCVRTASAIQTYYNNAK